MFPRFVYKGYRVAREDMVAFKQDPGFIHCIRGYSLEAPVSLSSTGCIAFNSAMKFLSSQVKRVLPEHPRPSP